MMWSKTMVGLVVSLLLAMSLFVNIGYFVPLQRDILLFIGYVGIFIVWAALMSWFYCSSSLRRPGLTCIGLFLLSSAANSVYYFGEIQ